VVAVGGLGGIAPTFLTSVLEGGEWSASAPAALYTRGKDSRYPFYGGLGGPQSRSGSKD
jgi:hypothetical protein